MDRRTYKSDAFAAVHETAEALHRIGAIDKRTMRAFDTACLAPLPNYTGRQIRAIRERENVSQPAFAHYLAVSKKLVGDWERGIKKPAGPTKRLLSIIEKRGLAALVV
jgi:putative transcriptional regulator